MRLRLFFIFGILGILFTPGLVSQEHSIRLEDSSDWWSFGRQEEFPSDRRIPVLRRVPNARNFEVAGIALEKMDDFSKIRSKFGPGTEVQRGDAASGRTQLCYVSGDGRYLIFEMGEVSASVYLIADGALWNGREFCTSSSVDLNNEGTASGLRLGTPVQRVLQLLGEPSVHESGTLIYHFSYRLKATPADLDELRKANPGMKEKEIVENFSYSDVEALIEARFTVGKLTFLAISRSETY